MWCIFLGYIQKGAQKCLISISILKISPPLTEKNVTHIVLGYILPKNGAQNRFNFQLCFQIFSKTAGNIPLRLPPEPYEKTEKECRHTM